MSEFPGLDKWYLTEDHAMDVQNVKMWQTVPGPVARMPAPTTLRVALWTGRVVDLKSIDRDVSVADVLERLFESEKDLSAAPLGRTRLSVDGRVMAGWRGAVSCYDGAPEGEALAHLVDPDGALRCNLIIEPCPKVALGVRRLRPWVGAAAAEAGEDTKHVLELSKARLRFAIPPKRKHVAPKHFRQDSADAEPWGSIMRFENFMKARSVHRGNHAKLRPLRSGRWKATFPGVVPISHRWHEKEQVALQGKSEDPSTVAAIYRPFTDAKRAPSREARIMTPPKRKGVWTAGEPGSRMGSPADIHNSDDDSNSTQSSTRKIGAFHGLQGFAKASRPAKMVHHAKKVVIHDTKQVFVAGEGFQTVELPENERERMHDPDVTEAYHEGRISRF